MEAPLGRQPVGQSHLKKKALLLPFFPFYFSSEFIEATRDFLNDERPEKACSRGKERHKGERESRKLVREMEREKVRETRWELYSLDLHHRRAIVLRNELEMVPRRFALALEFRDVRRQLVEIDFRGSRYRADLKTVKKYSTEIKRETEGIRSHSCVCRVSRNKIRAPTNQS